MSNSENTGNRIFVTGGSGFIAYHIVHRLLNEGYNVRTTARGAKVGRLRQTLATFYDSSRFEVVEVADVASGDFSEFLQGQYSIGYAVSYCVLDVDGIVHTAYPIVGRPDFDLAVRTAVEGSLHVLREGVKAGIRKYVTTSSFATFNVEAGQFGVHDYASLTEEAARNGDTIASYRYAKALCDRKVLEFQDDHPEIDITILAPIYVYSPFPPGFEKVIPEGDVNSMSTNLHVYNLLAKGTGHRLPMFPGYVDVRDVACAHVLALNSRPTSEVGHKRLALVSPHDSSWVDAIAHLANERPELKDRLLDTTDIPKPLFGNSVVGTPVDGLNKALGFKPSDYITWEDTILATVDSMIALEAEWKAKGFSVAVPTGPAE